MTPRRRWCALSAATLTLLGLLAWPQTARAQVNAAFMPSLVATIHEMVDLIALASEQAPRPELNHLNQALHQLLLALEHPGHRHHHRHKSGQDSANAAGKTSFGRGLAQFGQSQARRQSGTAAPGVKQTNTRRNSASGGALAPTQTARAPSNTGVMPKLVGTIHDVVDLIAMASQQGPRRDLNHLNQALRQLLMVLEQPGRPGNGFAANADASAKGSAKNGSAAKQASAKGGQKRSGKSGAASGKNLGAAKNLATKGGQAKTGCAQGKNGGSAAGAVATKGASKGKASSSIAGGIGK